MGIPIMPDKLAREILNRGESTRRSLAFASNMAAERGRTYLVRLTPKDQGEMKAAWKVIIAWYKKTGNQTLAVLENDAPHAGVVEGGARPHPVSKEGFLAIFFWAKRHGFKGASRRFQRSGRSRIQGPQHTVVVYGFPFSDEDAPAALVAQAIVRKINKHGQKATYFVRQSLGKMEKFLAAEIRREFRKNANRKAPVS